MTDNHDADSKKPREAYEPPQAIRLNSADFAYGDGCQSGNSIVKYRVNQHWGTCVTGKSAGEGCSAGIGVGGCYHGSAI
jgi:hypothetical protein